MYRFIHWRASKEKYHARRAELKKEIPIESGHKRAFNHQP